MATWKIDDHTIGKHLVLKAYLDAWFPILGSWNGRLLFVDGFAGPGAYENGELGSPIVAIDSYLQHTNTKLLAGTDVVFLFMESHKGRFAHLESVVASKKLPPNAQALIRNTEFDAEIVSILDYAQSQSTRLAKAFVMIDPFGVKGVSISTIKRLFDEANAECYISFMYEPIRRFIGTPEFKPHLDALFGDSSWEPAKAISDESALRAYLFDLFESKLRAAGAHHVTAFDLWKGNKLMYRVYFGTKHVKGCSVMKQAIWKVVPDGSYEFRGSAHHQKSLAFNSSKEEIYEVLSSELQSRFRGMGAVSIEALEAYMASDETNFHEGHLRKITLKPMEKNSLIQVSRAPGKNRGTFPKGTMVTFK